jgi:hypothetical protein
MKICTVCRLPKDDFPKHAGHRDGLSSNCQDCVKALARMRRLNIPRPPKTPTLKTPKVQKIVVPVDTIAVSMPSIFEVENRGKNYRSFCFESPLDGSVFSFSSYKEARGARESFRPAIRQETGG